MIAALAILAAVLAIALAVVSVAFVRLEKRHQACRHISAGRKGEIGRLRMQLFIARARAGAAEMPFQVREEARG